MKAGKGKGSGCVRIHSCHNLEGGLKYNAFIFCLVIVLSVRMSLLKLVGKEGSTAFG